MAAVFNRQSLSNNMSAITPDVARPCDAAAIMPPTSTTTIAAATSSSSSSSNKKNSEALAQYVQYRSAPTLYPSFDRLRFVRLPSHWLPSPLRQKNNNNDNKNNDNDDNDDNDEAAPPLLLQYWPALLYENYAELIRDLGKSVPPTTKAKFSVKHRKYGNKFVVARLLNWVEDSSTNATANADNFKTITTTSSNTLLFPEPTIHIVQLDDNSTTNTTNNNNNNSSLSQLESKNSSRVLSFYEHQFDLEECCLKLLRQYSSSSTTTTATTTKQKNGGEQQQESEQEEERRKVYNYARQFQKAVDMALNCLALDVGADIVHGRVVVEVGGEEEEAEGKGRNRRRMLENSTPSGGSGGGGGVVALNTTTTTDVATADVAVKNKVVKKRQVVEKRVQNLEVAITTHATTNVTIKPDAEPNEMKQQQQAVIITSSRNESITIVESKREGGGWVGGGGGGTKSRKEAASQTIPKKFQSAFKTTTATTTAAAATATAKDGTTTTVITTTTNQNINPLLPWKEVWKIMRSKGWTWKGSTGLMTGYRYIQPGCKIKHGQENIDYFNSESAVQDFARNKYGWGRFPHQTLKSLEQIIEEYHTKYADEVVPPLHPTIIIRPNEPWKDVWDKMRLGGGWTWKAGSGLMLDYYYIKPNCSIKGGVKGQDYFERVEDVQKFAKRNYGWVGEEAVDGSDGGSEVRPALMDLNENKKLPEMRRRRTESVSIDKPVTKKVKSAKSKMDEVKSIHEEEDEEDVMEEEGEEEDFEDQEMASSENDASDDDNMSRFSEARSTYSQSGFQSKKLFINECADEYVPSLEGEQIHPEDPWHSVWKAMRKAGWTWKGGTGLMIGYYYIKPGCNVKDGEEGKDYFVSEEDVQRFAERNYGWNHGVSSDNFNSRGKGGKRSLPASCDGSHFSDVNYDDGTAEEITKTKQTSKKIQTSNKNEQNDHASSAPLRPDPYNWKTLWPALQKDGWKVVKAGKYNRLHDWYYVRPDCDPGDGSSELHADYFLSEEDVCEFARQINYFEGYEESDPSNEEYAEQAQTKQAPKRAKSSSNHPSTPEGCQTQPQDPAKPLLSSVESCSSQFSSSSNDYYDWGNLWPVLQTGGWRVVKAFNPLHDWYYVRPNRDPKDSRSELGRHYFTCPDEVIDFVKRLDEKDGKQSRKSDIGGMLKAFEEEATVYSGSQL